MKFIQVTRTVNIVSPLFASFCLYSCCALCTAADLPAPFMVVIDNYDWQVERQVEMFELAARSAPEHSLSLPSVEDLPKRSASGLRFPNADGTFVTGQASCLSPTGKVVSFRFRTLPTETQFRKFIDGEIQRRSNKTTKADFDGLKVKLSSPPAVHDPSEPKSKPLISWTDSYWAWENGILVWSDHDDAHDVAIATLQKHVRAGRSRDRYGYVEPSVIPDSMKESLIGQFASYVGVRMQKKDAEDAASHAVRKAFGQNALDIAKSLLFDVESVSAEFRYPTNDKPAEGHVVLTCKSESQLAEVIRQLRSRRAPPSFVPADSRASVTVNLGLPEMVRPGLKALVANSDLNGTKVGQACVEAIDQGTVRMSSWIDTDADRPVISGTVFSAISSMSPELLARTLGGTVNDQGETVVPVILPFFGDSFGTQILSLVAHDNQLRFSMPLDEAAGQTRRVVSDDERIVPDVLVNFEADVRDSKNKTANKVLDTIQIRLEKMYQHWRIHSLDPGLLRLLFGSSSPNIPLTSLTEGARGSGDYTSSFKFSGAQSGTSLKAEVRIGKELFGLLLARRALTSGDIRKANRFK